MPTPPSIKKTCVECFTTLLRPAQIAVVVGSFQALGVTSLEDLCAFFEQQTIREQQLVFALDSAGVSASVRAELIQCLIIAGLPFTPLSQM